MVSCAASPIPRHMGMRLYSVVQCALWHVTMSCQSYHSMPGAAINKVLFCDGLR